MTNVPWCTVLPDIYGDQINRLPVKRVEEIRMRVGQPLVLRTDEDEIQIWPQVNSKDLEEVLQRATRFSVHSCAESLREGYVTIEGGHRIGVCGTGFIREGHLQSLRLVTSVCIRIANQISGCAENIYSSIKGSVLIIGPPGRGKTTLLRDLVAHLSDKACQRVGLVDERGEIAACVEGIPQLWVGRRTDILSNVRKDNGIMMLLRTMNPQWIAVDEITAEHDILAMEQAAYCGVNLMATAHGNNPRNLTKRPLYKKLLESGVFSQIAVIQSDRTCRVEEIDL